MNMEEINIEHGSGNVFADLGLPDAETHLLKAGLVVRIDSAIRQRGLKDAEAANQLGMTEHEVSCLLRGMFQDSSIERLLQLVTAIGLDVEIVVREPRSELVGRLRVGP